MQSADLGDDGDVAGVWPGVPTRWTFPSVVSGVL